MKKIETFNHENEVLKYIDDLEARNISTKNITVISNNERNHQVFNDRNIRVESSEGNTFDKVNAFFKGENTDSALLDQLNLTEDEGRRYYDDIHNGKYLVYVNDENLAHYDDSAEYENRRFNNERSHDNTHAVQQTNTSERTSSSPVTEDYLNGERASNHYRNHTNQGSIQERVDLSQSSDYNQNYDRELATNNRNRNIGETKNDPEKAYDLEDTDVTGEDDVAHKYRERDPRTDGRYYNYDSTKDPDNLSGIDYKNTSHIDNMNTADEDGLAYHRDKEVPIFEREQVGDPRFDKDTFTRDEESFAIKEQKEEVIDLSRHPEYNDTTNNVSGDKTGYNTAESRNNAPADDSDNVLVTGYNDEDRSRLQYDDPKQSERRNAKAIDNLEQDKNVEHPEDSKHLYDNK